MNKSIPTITNNVPCPFCGILCDDLTIKKQDNKLKVLKNGCMKAIQSFEKDVQSSCAHATIKGKNVSTDEAICAISTILNASHTPLFSGLGTDVSGIRQVLRLADKVGGVVDHMHGEDIVKNTLVLQDSGWITTTMAEIKNRADLVILVGTDTTKYARFFERVIWNKHVLFDKEKHDRQIVYIGDRLNNEPGISPTGKLPTVFNCKKKQIGEVILTLHALIAGAAIDKKQIAGISMTRLAHLAEQMKKASYGVVIWSPSELDIPHAELTIHNLCEMIKYLTRITRFSGFFLSGNDGSTTANNVCTWQSGFPLRVNFNRGNPDYDAYHYATHRLLREEEVDALLWISSFSTENKPPKTKIPSIVLTSADTKLNFEPDVFIPIATPGIDHSGHLFRTDSVIALPLRKLRQSPYQSVNEILAKVIKTI